MRTFLVLSLLWLWAAPASSESDDDKVERDLGNDRFAAGGSVTIVNAIAADLIAAGGSVEVNATVGGDALLTGGDVRVNADIGQGVYSGAGKLEIDSTVGRNVRVAAGQVILGTKSNVMGNVTAGGGQVMVRGMVKGYVQAAGGHVLIDGQVDGDVEATAGRVELGPHARIGGKLRYASREPLQRDPGAQVRGAIQQMQPHGGWPVPEDVEHRFGRRGGWIWAVGLLMLAVVLALAAPNAYRQVAETYRARFGMSVLLGFVTLVCVPIAALLFLITIIGVPLGLLALAIYAVLLLLGYVASGMSVGAWVVDRVKSDAKTKWWTVLGAGLGVFALSLLTRIPWVGGWIALLALLAGVGAIALQLNRLRTAL